MKRSKLSTRKRRNRLYDPQERIALDSYKHTLNIPEYDDVGFTVERNLETHIENLPFEPGYEILNKASEEYLNNLNTPITEPTKELPTFMNHGGGKQNHFYVFEKEHADKIAYWLAVFVVSLCVCLLLGAIIISWRLHLPDWCYK